MLACHWQISPELMSALLCFWTVSALLMSHWIAVSADGVLRLCAVDAEVQRRRSTGAVSDDEVVELLETLLSRDCTGRSSLLREYLLLLAKLSERDASLLERKMRAGTVLGEEQPQALAAAIGARCSGRVLGWLMEFAHHGFVGG